MKVALVGERVRIILPDGRSSVVLLDEAWELLDKLRHLLAEKLSSDLTRTRAMQPSSETKETTK